MDGGPGLESPESDDEEISEEKWTMKMYQYLAREPRDRYRWTRILVLKYSIVFCKPSLRSTRALHLRIDFALVVSG